MFLSKFGTSAAVATALCFSSLTLAAPASHQPITIKQPDGTSVTANIKGDEHAAWFEDENHRIFVFNSKTRAYEYATLENVLGSLKLLPTGTKVGAYVAGNEGLISKDALSQFWNQARHLAHPMKALKSKPDIRIDNSVSREGVMFASAATSTQSKPMLIVRVEFSDFQFNSAASVWSNKIFGTGADTVNSYYKEVSRDRITLSKAAESQGTANDGIVTVKLNYANPNPRNSYSLFVPIIDSVMPLVEPYVNFALYDSNSDGIVSAQELTIGFILAGGESTASSLPGVWGHASYYNHTTSNGLAVNMHYFAVGERHGDDNHDATIGIIAHEIGHATFDLPDLYNVITEEVEIWDIMGDGTWAYRIDQAWQGQSPTHMTGWSKWKANLAPANFVDAMYAKTSVTLNHNVLDSYSVTVIPTANFDEDYIVEHRAIYGFDEGLEPWIGVTGGSSGALVAQATGNRSEPLKMIRANNQLSGTSLSNLFYPGNNTRLAPNTAPNSSNRNGSGDATGIIVENISVNESSLSFDVRREPIPGALCKIFTATNPAHVTASRATAVTTGTWFKTTTYYAIGSNENLGTSKTTNVSLKEDPTGYFKKGTTCPTMNAPVIESMDVSTQSSRAFTQGEASDTENDIVRIEYDFDNANNWQRAITYATNGVVQYNFEAYLADGNHTVRTRAVDAGNRTSAIRGPLSFTILNVAPTCSIPRVQRDPDNYYTAYVNAQDVDTMVQSVQVRLNGGSWMQAINNGDWMLRLSSGPQGSANGLANGNYDVEAQVVDSTGLIGNCGPFLLEVGVEHAPLAPVISDTLLYADGVRAHGTVDDIDGDIAGAEYSIDNSATWIAVNSFYQQYDNSGFFEVLKTGLSIGTHSFRVRGVDARNVRGPASAAINFQVFAQVAPVCTVDNISLNEDGSGYASGTMSDANNDLESVEVKMVDTGEWIHAWMFGDWGQQISIQPLTAGSYTLEVRASDSRGAVGNCSKNFTVGSVQVAPTINSITTSVSGLNVTVSGTAADADNDLSTVEIQFDSTSNSWSQVSGTTTWSYTTALAAGTHKVRARARDAGGRESAITNWSDFTLAEIACFTTTLNTHATENRARKVYNILFYENNNGVNGAYLGSSGTASVSLQQTAPNVWKKVSGC